MALMILALVDRLNTEKERIIELHHLKSFWNDIIMKSNMVSAFVAAV